VGTSIDVLSRTIDAGTFAVEVNPMSKRAYSLAVAALAILVSAIGALASRHVPPTLAMSEAELAAGFARAMEDVVLEWDPSDPRSEAERMAVLHDFVYETYDASAWIPQSLFDANAITQTIVGDADAIVRDKVGLVPWDDNPLVPAFGMAPNAGSGSSLLWTVNCLVCHTAEIDGVTYFGAGAKTFDDLWLGEALKTLTNDRWLGRLEGTSDYDVARDAWRILTTHHHDKIDSRTRARSTAFAASHVELYMRTHDNGMPSVEDVGRGDVKTPPLWHTVAKMPAGRWYSDGSFHGAYPLMASSMELEKDRPFDDLVDVVIPRIQQQFDDVLQYLRPPPYPYEIDRELAERGRVLFESSEVGCARCHGTYDGEGSVDWPGVHRDIGTDPARAALVSKQFVAAFDDSPLAVHGELERSRGYAATPLTGVWANYPYLHNGSVPTLHHLLGPVSERPRIFEVMAARTLDRARVGQPLTRRTSDARLTESELVRRYADDRDWFYTGRPGSSNVGHDVWDRIGSEENRRAIIEYLKTL
jgi:mono/diheme cytochrome c family protein